MYFSAFSDEVTFRVVWKKNSYTVTFPLTEKALKVKEHIQTLTGKFLFVVHIFASQTLFSGYFG